MSAEKHPDRPLPAVMVTVRNTQGQDGSWWYTAHETPWDTLVVDFEHTEDLFSHHFPTTYATLRRQNVRHLEITPEAFAGQIRLIGQPVDRYDDPRRGSPNHPLGPLDLRLVSSKRIAGYSGEYMDFVMPTLDIRENWHGRLWLRFMLPEIDLEIAA